MADTAITYAYGWKPSLPDIRDRLYAFPQELIASLPPSADLTGEYPPVYNQLQLGSCVDNATAGELQHVQRKQTLAMVMPSRLFLYYNARDLEGTTAQDSGSSVRDGLKAIARWGFCRENTPAPNWEYNIEKFRQKPPQECYDDAVQNIITDYASVTQTPDQIKGAIASGHGVIIGFTVYSSMETPAVDKSGIVPMPTMFDRIQGGHAVILVGYSESSKLYKFRNSWGTGWGASGYGFLPFAYVHNPRLADDFWVINTLVNPTPPTPPVGTWKWVLTGTGTEPILTKA